MKCLMYLCAIVIGLMIVSTRSLEKPQIDDRPAPWILYGLLVAIGVFLIHNLIEFSLFEPGLLCLFGLLAGSALGIRQAGAEAPRRGNLFPGIALAAVLTACVAAVIWILIPTARAQLAEYRGDEALRTGNFEQASAEYQTAWADQPLNAQYPFLAARALHLEAFKTHPIPDSQRDKILSLYALSIDHNPSAVNPYLWRAGFAGMIGDHSRVIRDYRTALELNPNEVSIRLDFAQALKSMNKIETAHEQMAIALKYNDQLDAAEPKRLSSDKVRSIQNEIDQAPTTAPAH